MGGLGHRNIFPLVKRQASFPFFYQIFFNIMIVSIFRNKEMRHTKIFLTSAAVLAALSVIFLLARTVWPGSVWDGRVEKPPRWGRGGYSREWREGKPHGLWTDYFPNHTKRTEKGFYHGLAHGYWRAWSEKGILESEEFFRNGIQEGEARAWHGNGRFKFKGGYRGGKKDGLFENFSESGEKLGSCFYRDGRESGKCEEWYPNGKLKFSGFYREGKKDGLFEGVR